MAPHPDLAAEQAYIDHAYACLESTRQAASRLTSMVEVGRGGTEQARFEREVIYDTVVNRLTQLAAGRRRTVLRPHRPGADDRPTGTGALLHRPHRGQRRRARSRSSSTGGRRWPSRSTGRPAASRWAWPGAATSPPGAAQLLGIEDELFGDTLAEPRARRATAAERRITGQGALFSALETARTGRLGDIVATIQGEQDEIIRAPLPGVLVVQGGPGHRQDRRGAAPRRLPPLHAPLPARGPGRAGHRPQPALPRLHRAGPPVARRGRRGAGRAGRPGARRQRPGPTTGASPPG